MVQIYFTEYPAPVSWAYIGVKVSYYCFNSVMSHDPLPTSHSCGHCFLPSSVLGIISLLSMAVLPTIGPWSLSLVS
jgi:hypothetical protein